MKFLETDKALTFMPRMPNMVGGINYNDDRVESEGEIERTLSVTECRFYSYFLTESLCCRPEANAIV